MHTDELRISAEEVRTIARYPHRGRLLGVMLSTLLAGVGLLLSFREAPVLDTSDLRFDPSACTPGATKGRCPAHVSAEVRRIPTGAQYARWRAADVVTALERTGECRRYPFSDGSTPGPHGRDASNTLAEIDDWAWIRLVAREEGTPPPAERLHEALFVLGTERDWSASPPTRSVTRPSGHVPDERTRAVNDVLAALAPLLDEDRAALVRDAWSPLPMHLERYEQRVAMHEWALAGCRIASLMGRASVMLGLALGVAWLWLAPVPIVVGLHHLRIGRRKIPWSEVGAADWNASPPQIVVNGTRVPIGRMRALVPEARGALARATDQAIERRRALGRLDDAALDSVRRLGRRPSS